MDEREAILRLVEAVEGIGKSLELIEERLKELASAVAEDDTPSTTIKPLF
jgi:hypothetical protein